MTTPIYPLSGAQIRQKRRQRAAAALRGELGRLAWERRELQQEYQRVSNIYARHLERLSAKAGANAAKMAKLASRTETTVKQLTAP